MRKITIIFAIFLTTAFAFGQGRGGLGTVSADTLNGNETVNFAVGSFTGTYESIAVVAKCTQVGGTSDGTLTLYGSLDNTNWVFLNGAADSEFLTASPKASLTGTDMNQITITNGLIASWVVEGAPYRYYRVAGVGTASDSTLINITYMYK